MRILLLVLAAWGVQGLRNSPLNGDSLVQQGLRNSPLNGDSLVQQAMLPGYVGSFKECKTLSAVIDCAAFKPKHLGAGGFGQSWLAQDHGGRKVVVKLLINPDKTGIVVVRRRPRRRWSWKRLGWIRDHEQHREWIENAREECENAQELAKGSDQEYAGRGPQRIMRCFGHNLGTHDDAPDTRADSDPDTDDDRVPMYLLLEYSGGRTLDSFVEHHEIHKKWTMPKVKQVAKQLLEAIAFLQSFKEPWIHHDIKPGNVVIKEFGDAAAGAEPKFTLQLIDLGAAVHHDPKAKTWRKRLPFSEAYAPPELEFEDGRTVGGRHYDRKNPKAYDMYAWGVMLFELVTGLPFELLMLAAIEKDPAYETIGGDGGVFEHRVLGQMVSLGAEHLLRFLHKQKYIKSYQPILAEAFGSNASRSFFENAIKTLSVKPGDRPTAAELLEEKWLRDVETPDEPDRLAEAALTAGSAPEGSA